MMNIITGKTKKSIVVKLFVTYRAEISEITSIKKPIKNKVYCILE